MHNANHNANFNANVIKMLMQMLMKILLQIVNVIANIMQKIVHYPYENHFNGYAGKNAIPKPFVLSSILYGIQCMIGFFQNP